MDLWILWASLEHCFSLLLRLELWCLGQGMHLVVVVWALVLDLGDSGGAVMGRSRSSLK